MSLNWRHHQQDEMDRCKLDYAQMSGNFNGNMFKIAAFGTKSTFFCSGREPKSGRNSSEVGCGHSRSVSTCLKQSELAVVDRIGNCPLVVKMAMLENFPNQIPSYNDYRITYRVS